jgi:hypothetical protein
MVVQHPHEYRYPADAYGGCAEFDIGAGVADRFTCSFLFDAGAS